MQEYNISSREKQCAQHLIAGMTSKETANLLCISPRTVEVYLERLKSRFQCRNKVQLAALLVAEGLIEK
mgnify:CR=1 FL=1